MVISYVAVAVTAEDILPYSFSSIKGSFTL